MYNIEEAAEKLGKAFNSPIEVLKSFSRMPVKFSFFQKLKLKVYLFFNKPVWAQRLILKLLDKLERVERALC